MTIRAILEAIRTALAGVLGSGWPVHAMDDEWSALDFLGTGLSGARIVLLPDDFLADPASPKGLAGTLNGRVIVQIQKGLPMDRSKEQDRLLDMEERVRRALFAIVFQLPGDPDFPSAWTNLSTPPHPEVTGLRQTGAGSYKPPDPGLMLEHPAREIRWALYMGLRLTDSTLRIDLPLSAGN